MLFQQFTGLMHNSLRLCSKYPFRDVKEIVQHVMQDSYENLYVENKEISYVYKEKMVEYLHRRISGEPLERICRVAFFRKISVYVNEHVLIPRVETESIVDIARSYLCSVKGDNADTQNFGSSKVCVELGVGSGAVILSFLKENEDFIGIGTDISFEAVRVAQYNCQRMGMSSRCYFFCMDWCNCFYAGIAHCLFVNPPYVQRSIISVNNLFYDPYLALDGGMRGLDCYHRFIPGIARLLKKNGVCIIEIFPEIKIEVLNIIKEHHYKIQGVHCDLFNRERFVVISL